MRRSVPLHYTDYGYGEHATKLDFHRTMFEWLPYFRETSQSWDLEESGASASRRPRTTRSPTTAPSRRC